MTWRGKVSIKIHYETERGSLCFLTAQKGIMKKREQRKAKVRQRGRQKEIKKIKGDEKSRRGRHE